MDMRETEMHMILIIGKASRMAAWALVCLAAFSAASVAAPRLDLRSTGTAAGRRFVTLGFVFAPGDIPAGKSLAAKSVAGGSISIQTDAKATHADGSLRHAVLTLEAADVSATAQSITLSAAAAPGGAAIMPAQVLATAYDAVVSLDVGGIAYNASARAALQAAADAGKIQTWLSGPLVSEWLVIAPLRTAAGIAHPHLTARFAIRAYAGLGSIRTDLTVENCWAFEPGPRGFTYAANVSVDGKPAWSAAVIKHTHHARWRKIFWSGEPPSIDARPDQEYWFSTGCLPNYDRSVKVTEAILAQMPQAFEPISNGNWTSSMPETGAHDDIGPLPRQSALYLLTLDPRARENVLANGMAGGSYQIHYRDKSKDLPVSIDDYPYMTLLGNPGDTQNPLTGKSEAFPIVTEGLDQYEPDDAHQPSIGYLPYMITGDYYFLEELQFWADWNMVQANPGYRDAEKGLLKWSQARGQAWSMRTLGEAAYLTPDAHPLKAYFTDKLRNNLAWYTDRYVGAGSGSSNKLGWLDAGGSLAYGAYGIAPWQDDFFTWSIGHLAALGFTEARPLALWKGRFVAGRMLDPGYCWLEASAYSLQVGGADGKSPYATFGELFQANFPGEGCSGKAMSGYPEEARGYPANMQPALAAAVDAGVPQAAEAWARYQARDPKQDYSEAPQFAVVPGLSGGAGIRNTVGRVSALKRSRMELRAHPAGAAYRWERGGPAAKYDAKGGR